MIIVKKETGELRIVSLEEIIICEEKTINGTCYYRPLSQLQSNKYITPKYDHLKLQKFAGKVYVCDVDATGKTKCIYISKTGRICETNRRLMADYDDYLELQEFAGKVYVFDVDKTGKTKRIYNFEIDIIFENDRWLEAKCDHLELQEFAGKVYAFDVDEDSDIRGYSDDSGILNYLAIPIKKEEIQLKVINDKIYFVNQTTESLYDSSGFLLYEKQ